MSIDSDDEYTPSLPGIPDDHPAAGGPIYGIQNQVNTPPMDWGESHRPADPAKATRRKADAEALNEKLVRTDPGMRNPAGRSARQGALNESKEATQAETQASGQEAQVAGAAPKQRKSRMLKAKDRAPDSADENQQTDAVAKPARKSRATPKAVAAAAEQGAPASAEATKSPRVSRKRSKPANLEQGEPAAETTRASSGDIPPITQEAITFLSNPDAKATDLFKLQPESQEFVQYHITNMQRLEADIAFGYSHLEATKRTFAPVVEKVTDALLSRLSKGSVALAKAPTAEVAAPDQVKVSRASYGSKQASIGAQQFVTVKLGKMEISPEKRGVLEPQAAQAMAEDMTRANKVMSTALVMMSAPIGDLTREIAADLVAGDLNEVRAIRDDRTRQLALNAMLQSSHAQPHYKGEFERHAPDLVAPAQEAGTAIHHEKAAWTVIRATAPAEARESAQEVENTIERGIAPERDRKPSQDDQLQASTADTGAAERAPQPGIGKRFLRAVGSAAQVAGTWLQSKGEEGPAPAAAQVSLEKEVEQPSPGKPAAVPDEKSRVIPETVARRFLKVEHDYYFLDKTPAFSDRGEKLATRGAHPEVVRSMVEIAKARGWDSITAKGDAEFRRGIWMEGMQSGLKVAGYQPTALDLAELANLPAKNSVEKGLAKERAEAQAQPTVKPLTADPGLASAAAEQGQRAALMMQQVVSAR